MVHLLLAAWLLLAPSTQGLLVSPPLTLQTICSTVWGKDARHVPPSWKREVLHRPESPKACREGRGCEVDHVVPRSLGGADDRRNLTAQCCILHGHITGEAHVKDVLEVRLHRRVCDGTVSLADAQAVFLVGDWHAGLTQYPR